MNKVDSELERVTARYVAQVVAELVFLLIAQVGEKSDWRGELVVAERFETGDSQRRYAERKLQGKTEIGVARLGEMQQAGVEDQSAASDLNWLSPNVSKPETVSAVTLKGNCRAKPRSELRVSVRCNRLASRTKVPSHVELKV